ncbi:solute carrier family 15 member 1-like isoform X1 [Maniola hyperantus]|uniref:solute carrier family 15 member 1-like isoform X1 n=1 Tax=Aphantopus hyperantus TaxID=2795564 RepID=UPI0015696F18|nr:solute carrier family 15 member 1-like [Maniola hyperantus]
MPHGHPTSIFCIIATEFCERFSFCGLRTILSLYLRNILCLHENAATVVYHIFIMMCYTMPLMGALLADNYIGRYRVILYFSIIYFVGTLLLCCSAIPPLMLPPTSMSMIGLVLIATGTGGIKPCVAAFGGDQFRLPEDNNQLQKFFSTFYCIVNLGGFMGMVVTPALRRGVMCFGDDACYALGFGFPAILVLISIVIFVMGKPWYRIKQPRDNVTLKFVACAWYALKKRINYDRNIDGPPNEHWLDYSIDKYGEKLVTDMKIVFSILYLYLPVPIFWSLFDQQGSRWTFQASRLRSELFGIALMPDQLQVMNPAMVLLMIPVCPGGAWPVLPELSSLHKMFAGGILAAMAFFCAAILQISIERSTLQVPGHHQTGIILLNTLTCSVELAVSGEGLVHVEPGGTAVVTPLPRLTYAIVATCPKNCAGRIMKRRCIKIKLRTVAGMFMPVIVGQNSDDQLSFYFMDPGPFAKSLTGKPKLKVVYIGDTGPNKNVSIEVETDKRLCDVYFVSDAPVDHIGESAYMCVQPGKFRWRATSAGGEVSGSGEGYLRAGGVYVLCLRERLGRLDMAVLHAPNPPNELNLAWIVPQYLLVSMAEIMFAVSGLEFSFTQAPKSMKTITIAAWYMSVAIGNLIVILVAQAKIFQSRAMEFFVYAGVLTAAMLIFLRMAHGYCSRTMDDDGSSTESRPLLHRHSRMISVHSATTGTQPYSCVSRESSATSCLVHMERARTSAWPMYTVVHVGTPSTNDKKATTLAKD